MSGKGGGPTPTGNGGDCAAFYKDIPLLSPNPEVVGNLEKGDQLDFEVSDANGRKTLRVLRGGKTAGAVTKNAAQLIRCIENGHNYIAIVTAVDGGSITLEARMVG